MFESIQFNYSLFLLRRVVFWFQFILLFFSLIVCCMNIIHICVRTCYFVSSIHVHVAKQRASLVTTINWKFILAHFIVRVHLSDRKMKMQKNTIVACTIRYDRRCAIFIWMDCTNFRRWSSVHLRHSFGEMCLTMLRSQYSMNDSKCTTNIMRSSTFHFQFTFFRMTLFNSVSIYFINNRKIQRRIPSILILFFVFFFFAAPFFVGIFFLLHRGTQKINIFQLKRMNDIQRKWR